MDNKFLLRKSTGDQPVEAEADLRDLFRKGQCKPSDFVFEFSSGQWCRFGDHASLAEFFSEKPAQAPERRVIYYLPAGGTSFSQAQGPLSTKELQQRAQLKEICGQTWVFVEGDKDWRQVKNVKVLADMLPALPADKPSPPPKESAPSAIDLHFGDVPATAEASASVEVKSNTIPSIRLDLGGADAPAGATSVDHTIEPEAAPTLALDLSKVSDEPMIEQEEDATLALDTLGLQLHGENSSGPPSPPPFTKLPGIAPLPATPSAPLSATPSAPLPMATAPSMAPPMAPPGLPPMAAPSAPPMAPPAPSAAMAAAISRASSEPASKQKALDAEGFDGIVAEIPTDPIWLVKQASSETVSGPFRFLDVVKFLEEGKLNKNDKISRAGTKAFVKIQQQYEFNVKFSLETVIENGVERQKILIRRRHPRVPYITGVQIVSRHGNLAGHCVNISAGGILMEVAKAEFNLGEIIDTKILPGLIPKAITCRSLVIGKIPKIPPGYALKFEDLKQDDKEAIEFYVQETLKREMAKKN